MTDTPEIHVETHPTPPLWAELRSEDPFPGPCQKASVVIDGEHIGTFDPAAITPEWIYAVTAPGSSAHVNYHRSGGRGMVGVVVFEQPEQYEEERPVHPELRELDYAPTPEGQLARSLERVTMELLGVNTRLVERVLKTADVAITASDRTEAQSRSVEALSRELEVARRNLDGAAGALEEAHLTTAAAHEEAQRSREEAIAASAHAQAAEAAAEAGAGGVFGQAIEAVVEHVVDQFGATGEDVAEAAGQE